MTPKFDALITELLTPFAKKQENKSRYWEPGKAGLSGVVRAQRNLNNKTASQRSKLGNQQYVGNGVSTIRHKNRSKKSADEIGVAKGIGGHLRIDGTNPKEIGASVNSKQGNMEIKVAHPNGLYKIGPRIKTEFPEVKRPNMDNLRKSDS